jgi:hypothetical protein
MDGQAGFVITFGNFEGTYYRYTKRHEAARELGAATERTAQARTGFR